MRQKQQLLILPNDDKTFHEPIDQKNLGNFAHPFRAILCAPPNAGKTNTVYNILLQKNPPFEKIYILHNDPNTKEYQNIDCEYIEELPNIGIKDDIEQDDDEQNDEEIEEEEQPQIDRTKNEIF